jgi:hypothetical protein
MDTARQKIIDRNDLFKEHSETINSLRNALLRELTSLVQEFSLDDQRAAAVAAYMNDRGNLSMNMYYQADKQMILNLYSHSFSISVKERVFLTHRPLLTVEKYSMATKEPSRYSQLQNSTFRIV